MRLQIPLPYPALPMRRPLATSLTFVALVISLSILAALLMLYEPPAWDFAAYRTAARLFLAGENPYSLEAVTLDQGIGPDFHLMMNNPPWFLPIAIPLAFLPARVYLLLQFLALAWCVQELTRGRYTNRTSVLAALMLSFPVMSQLFFLQSSIFVLVGFVLFLKWRVQRPAWSGAALALAMGKPHLLSIFVIVWVIGEIRARRWIAVASFMRVLLTLTALAIAIRPSVLFDYLIFAGRPLEQLTISIGSILRFLVSPGAAWLQFVPWFIGLALALRCQRSMSLLLISVLASPYSWGYDLILLFVPMVALARPRQWLEWTAANAIALVLWWLRLVPAHFAFFWLPWVVVLSLVYRRSNAR